VMMYHGVTLGGRSLQRVKRHPTVGDHVTIGTGARVLGPVTIGENASVGANAVVVKDVPAGSTGVGVPATVREQTQQPDLFADPALWIRSGGHRTRRQAVRRAGRHTGRHTWRRTGRHTGGRRWLQHTFSDSFCSKPTFGPCSSGRCRAEGGFGTDLSS